MKNKRDAGIELARIIGCFIVIGVHVSLSSNMGDGKYDFSRLLLSCFLADGVAVFWIIMGAFFFNNNNYKLLWKRTGKHIIIPTAAFTIFTFYFGRCMIDCLNITDSVHHTAEEYKEFFKALISWSNPVSGMGHLWYIYVYLLLILLYPVLRSFVSWLDEDEHRQKIYMIISFCLLLLNDISNNGLGAFSHHSINGAFPAAIETVWGHIIYRHRNEILNKIKGGWFALIFLCLNAVRALIQMHRYNTGDTTNYILYWYSSIGIICSLMIVLFAMSCSKLQFMQKLSGSICYVASYTFGIYIVHQLIAKTLNAHLDLKNKLWGYIAKNINYGWIGETLYTIVMPLLIFSLSFLCIFIIRCIKKLCCSTRK